MLRFFRGEKQLPFLTKLASKRSSSGRPLIITTTFAHRHQSLREYTQFATNKRVKIDAASNNSTKKGYFFTAGFPSLTTS